MRVVLAGALVLFLGGCGTGGSHRPCSHAPAVPPVGTTARVAMTPLPDVHGFRANLGGRQWLASGITQHPTAYTSTATVVPASPFPVLRVRSRSGLVTDLQLLPVGCA